MDEITHKICLKCKDNLPISNFYFRKENGQYRGCCKKCKSLNTKEEIAARLLAETKICKHCGIEKNISEYQKAGGGKWLQPYCKPCDAERKKRHFEENKEREVAKKKKYYEDNKAVISEKAKIYIENNKDAVKKRRKSYRERNLETIQAKQREYGKNNREKINENLRKKRQENKEFYREKSRIIRQSRTPEQIKAKKKYDKEYKIKNKHKYAEWKKNNIDKVRASKRAEQARKMSDPNYRIKKNLRSRIRIALKGITKSDTTVNILGCSIEYFKEYIESQFKDGMSWDNYGKKGWHIDHKIPVSWFNLTNPNCLKLAFNYKNHQPLFWEENLLKGNKYHHKLH